MLITVVGTAGIGECGLGLWPSGLSFTFTLSWNLTHQSCPRGHSIKKWRTSVQCGRAGCRQGAVTLPMASVRSRPAGTVMEKRQRDATGVPPVVSCLLIRAIGVSQKDEESAVGFLLPYLINNKSLITKALATEGRKLSGVCQNLVLGLPFHEAIPLRCTSL